jgi:hypothetical protein
MAGRRLHIALVLLFKMTALHAQTGKASGLPDELAPATAETDRSDRLALGLRISSEVDDNALNDNRSKQPNLMTAIEPDVTWKLSRSHLEWLLHYSNGFSVSHQLPTYNSQSHSLDVGLRFRPTKRLRLAVTNSLVKSTNPFDFFRTGAAPGGGQSSQPNDFLLNATTSRTSEQAGAEATYALSRHGTVGASGSFTSLRFSAPAANQPPVQFLGDESSVGGNIFYSHHISRSQWSRVDYGVQRLVFSGNSSLVHNVFYTHTISLSQTARLSVFAGPEHATAGNTFGMVHPSPMSTTTWGWAAGAIYNWRLAATHLTLGFYRKISAGSGLVGAAWLSSATAELQHRITRRWIVDLAGAYDDNKTLDAPRNVLSFLWGAVGLTRTLNHDISVEFKYWRVHQVTDVFGVGSSGADHNRVSVSLGYAFKARLGR